MAARVLHLLSQRPGWTGSGVALDALMRTAQRAGWEQGAVVGTLPDDPMPAVADEPPADEMPADKSACATYECFLHFSISYHFSANQNHHGLHG